MIKFKLNGNDYTSENPMAVSDLLEKMGIHSLRVAVEINLSIISKEKYKDTLVCEGDQVEVIEFVGGG